MLGYIDMENLSSSDIYRLMGMNDVLADIKKVDFKDLRKNYRSGANGLPVHLYKYRSVSGEDNEKYLKDFIVDGKIWLADKTGLNDPTDLDFNWVLNDNKNEVRLWWDKNKKDFLEKYPHLSPAQRLLLGQRVRNARLSPQAVEKMKKDIWDYVGVYCLCSDPRSTHMWTHYASSSEGVCVQLASFRDPLLGMARKVIYTNKVPVLKLPSEDYSEPYMFKGETWSPEKEWRVVVPVTKKIVKINNAAISSVILGLRASAETKDFVFHCNEERFRNGFQKFKVLKTEIINGSYELKILRA